MNELVIALGWAGMYGVMALGAIGSVIGCAVAGQAAIGAMVDTESGHGRFIGVSVMPSSQVIYGIVVMFTLQRSVTRRECPGPVRHWHFRRARADVFSHPPGPGLRLGDSRQQNQAGNLRSVAGAGRHRRGLRGIRLRLCAGAGG